MISIRRVGSSVAIRGAILLTSLASVATASAQTTKTLYVAKDATLVGGAYASTPFGDEPLLVTRASDDPTYERRAVLTFDTETTVPDNTTIQSAKLVLTVRGGNAESRQLRSYGVPVSFDEETVSWNMRKSSTGWTYAGGDVANLAPSTATATGTVGSTVTFDVTAAVQKAISGAYGSRYARFLVMDEGASSRESYREFHSGQSADSAKRPRLVVTYGSGSSSAPPAATTTGKILRVLHWNIHHGVGTDGKYDINRLATWMATMKPDVITLNEVEKYTSWGNEDQPARFKSLLASKTGRTWYAHFTQEFGGGSANGKGHLILSVYPFDSTGRSTLTASSGLNGAGAVGEASIVVNGRHVNLVVSHLDPSSQTMRLTQAKQTINWAASFAENRIVTGDMNAWPDQSSIAEYNKTYHDSWAVAESKGTASAFSALSPSGATKKGRIDYIFYSKGASNLVVKESRVYDTRSSGVMPSDHRPVLTVFEVR